MTHSTTPAPLAGKVAVVTGAAAGNGRAIARRLAADGARVACVDLQATSRNPDFDGSQTTHDLIVAAGGEAVFVRCDVSDGASVQAMYAEVVESLGTPGVVVANAGISPQPPVALPEEDYDLYRKVVSVNQDGAWWTAREGARLMRDAGTGGRIVLMSSIAGLLGTDSGAHYCMTKGAVIQLARALAFQMAGHGITVNAVCPGFVRTAMTAEYLSDPERERGVLAAHPLGRVGEASDIAGAVAFLVGPDASWITGVALPVDGGYAAV